MVNKILCDRTMNYPGYIKIYKQSHKEMKKKPKTEWVSYLVL